MDKPTQGDSNMGVVPQAHSALAASDSPETPSATSLNLAREGSSGPDVADSVRRSRRCAPVRAVHVMGEEEMRRWMRSACGASQRP